MRLAVIGFGKMGEALSRCFSEKRAVDEIVAYDVLENRLKAAEALGFKTASSAREAIELGDAVLLAVKPGDAEAVSKAVGDSVKGKLLISILAGVKTRRLEELFKGARVVRVMPNINAAVGAAISAIARGSTASEEDVRLVEKLFSAAGDVIVVDEKLMDAITALSGCGPALVAVLIDGLALAGVKIGLPRPLALRLVLGVVKGTVLHLEKLGSVEKLVEMVATPGGATIEGLHVLEAGGVKGLLMDAVEASYLKSVRLG